MKINKIQSQSLKLSYTFHQEIIKPQKILWAWDSRKKSALPRQDDWYVLCWAMKITCFCEKQGHLSTIPSEVKCCHFSRVWLCDPIDGSPPGSPIPGILQARTLEWVAISLVAQWCPALWEHMDCSPPGSSVHGFLQARILERVAIPFSRGSSQPKNQTQVSCTAGRFFTNWVKREDTREDWIENKSGKSQNTTTLHSLPSFI